MWSPHPAASALLLATLLLLGGPGAALDTGAERSSGSPIGVEGSLEGDRAQQASQPPLLPSAMNEKEVLTDDANDVRMTIGDGAWEDYETPVDIVSLKVAETEGLLSLRLHHRGYPAEQATLSEYVLLTEAYCQIWFSLGDREDLRFGIDLTYPVTFDGDTEYSSQARFLLRETMADNSTRTSYLFGVPSGWVDADHFEMILAKEWLQMGAQMPTPLKNGDTLERFEVDCYRQTPTLFIQATDDAVSDPREAFRIQLAPRTDEISIAATEDHGAVAVVAGETSKFQIQVQNHAERKLLVNVTAQVVDPQGRPLDGWSVRSAATLELGHNTTLPATIVVAADPDALHRSGGMLKVVAYPLGFEEKAVLTKPVYASVPPSPEKSTLYFHNVRSMDFCWFICVQDSPVGALEFRQRSFALNVLENDPELDREPTASDRTSLFSSEQAQVFLDVPLARPIRLDPDDFIDLTLSLATEVPRDVRLSADLRTGEHGVVARTNKVVALSDGFTSHTLHFPVTDAIIDLPKGETLGLFIYVEDAGAFGFNIFGGSGTSEVDWDPRESTLHLPLVALPERKENITDGRALPSIVLGNSTDREEYVNPDQPVAFDVRLLNEGTETDTLRLTTESSQPGWRVAFHPGNQFKLGPGTSAPLCVLVTAPSDAKEGDVTNLTLTATSKSDALVQSQAELTLIVTTEIEFEPESCRELSEDEYVAPEADQAEDSPLGVLPFLALGLLGIGLWRRSGRRDA